LFMPLFFSNTVHAPPTIQRDGGKNLDIKQAASKYMHVHVQIAHPLV
jgi:hypothetical protein